MLGNLRGGRDMLSRHAQSGGAMMPMYSRRQFLASAGAASTIAATGLSAGTATAAMGPNDKFDVLIKGGEVLDPSQNLKAKRDIGIRFGMIEALEVDIPAEK